MNLKLSIDSESVNIYIDNGDEREPTHIVYWHLDEIEEDASMLIVKNYLKELLVLIH